MFSCLRLFRSRKKENLADLTRRLYEERLGQPMTERTDQYLRIRYERDGQLDFETYKAIQQLGNVRKLKRVFASEEIIRLISAYSLERIPSINLVLCHGTRNAAEQKYFRKYLGSEVSIIGTEISDTASQFPDTIQWDFHEVKDEWLGAADIIYSNSWDHSYDPELLFRRWGDCLSPRGIMFLEHTKYHTPEEASILDPFGITCPALVEMLNKIGSGVFRVEEVMTELPERTWDRKLVVVRRTDCK